MTTGVGIYYDVVFRLSDEDEVAIRNHDAFLVSSALEDVAETADRLRSELGSREIVLGTADEVTALMAAVDLIAAGDEGISGDLRVLRHRLSGRARQLGRSRRPGS